MKRFALAAFVLGIALSANRSQAQNTGIDLQGDCRTKEDAWLTTSLPTLRNVWAAGESRCIIPIPAPSDAITAL